MAQLTSHTSKLKKRVKMRSFAFLMPKCDEASMVVSGSHKRVVGSIYLPQKARIISGYKSGIYCQLGGLLCQVCHLF